MCVCVCVCVTVCAHTLITYSGWGLSPRGCAKSITRIPHMRGRGLHGLGFSQRSTALPPCVRAHERTHTGASCRCPSCSIGNGAGLITCSGIHTCTSQRPIQKPFSLCMCARTRSLYEDARRITRSSVAFPRRAASRCPAAPAALLLPASHACVCSMHTHMCVKCKCTHKNSACRAYACVCVCDCVHM